MSRYPKIAYMYFYTHRVTLDVDVHSFDPRHLFLVPLVEVGDHPEGGFPLVHAAHTAVLHHGVLTRPRKVQLLPVKRVAVGVPGAAAFGPFHTWVKIKKMAIRIFFAVHIIITDKFRFF